MRYLKAGNEQLVFQLVSSFQQVDKEEQDERDLEHLTNHYHKVQQTFHLYSYNDA